MQSLRSGQALENQTTFHFLWRLYFDRAHAERTCRFQIARNFRFDLAALEHLSMTLVAIGATVLMLWFIRVLNRETMSRHW